MKGNSQSFGNVIIEIDSDDAVCCLCLEPPERCNNLLFKCCKQHIHKQCYFLIILNGYNDCPLCRTPSNPYDYFDEKALLIHYGMLSKEEQDMYYHSYQELQYEKSKLNCKGLTIPRLNMLVTISISRIRRNMLMLMFMLMFVVVFYVSIMLPLHEQSHRSYQTTRPNNSPVPLEYYLMVNN